MGPCSMPPSDDEAEHKFMTDVMFLKTQGPLCIGVMCAVALVLYAGHRIHKLGRGKLFVHNSPQYIRTWHGYIKYSRYQRHADRMERVREKCRGRFNWKTTTADYKWLFFDPTGMKKREYQLRRERTLLRYLPKWTRSLEPHRHHPDKYRDLEQGVCSKQIFRIELPPRHGQISQSLRIISHADVSHSCVGVTPDNPFMTGALPDYCDCPIAHVVGREKSTDPPLVGWHAKGNEPSRVVWNQLLKSRKNTHRSVIKDVRGEADVLSNTLSTTITQLAQRADTLPRENVGGLGSQSNLQNLVSTSTKAFGKMPSGHCELGRNLDSERIRRYPHHPESSTSCYFAYSVDTATIEAFKQPTAPDAVISDYNKRRLQEVSRNERSVSDRSISRADTNSSLSRVSKKKGDLQVEVSRGSPRLVPSDCQVSLSPFQNVLGRIRRFPSGTRASRKKGEPSHTLPSNGDRRHLQDFAQIDGNDDSEPLKEISNGKVQREEHERSKGLRANVETDGAMEGSSRYAWWPHRFSALGTIGSRRAVSESTGKRVVEAWALFVAGDTRVEASHWC